MATSPASPDPATYLILWVLVTVLFPLASAWLHSPAAQLHFYVNSPQPAPAEVSSLERSHPGTSLHTSSALCTFISLESMISCTVSAIAFLSAILLIRGQVWSKNIKRKLPEMNTF
jgi:hypothetical protein